MRSASATASSSAYSARLRRRLRSPARAAAYLTEALVHGGRTGLRVAVLAVVQSQGVVQTGNLMRRSRTALAKSRRRGSTAI
jgi:hypothetical protein